MNATEPYESAKTLDTFIGDVASLVGSIDDEHEITKRVAALLSALLAGGYRLPPEVTRPSDEHHVTYPLHIAPDDSWSLASVVWNIGQRTPVHGHETWGVAGIYAGAERELRYLKPASSEPCTALTPAGEQVWARGQVTVCCTTDDDVHAVTAVGDEPTVGIHVYGGNIGTLNRRLYDPATGAVRWFVSGWDSPAVD
ncbi:cysteine dioxygenase family protein [Sphaerisporangium aureirubrum]|uniref:Cysteine dioxygenase n=1 Tax=Sphaerisporangium aureirubrum TaxID=1544736 RepID=A0ABW1N9X1_9ACTN